MIDEDDPEGAVPKVEAILNDFIPHYEELWLAGAQKKLGLENPTSDIDGDKLLLKDWLNLLELHSVDYTLAWRRLADAADGNLQALEALFPAGNILADWLARWHQRTAQQSASDTAERMRLVNPIYIPRNHLVEEALDSASEGDLQPFEGLLAVLKTPFAERPTLSRYATPAPKEFMDQYETFCGT